MNEYDGYTNKELNFFFESRISNLISSYFESGIPYLGMIQDIMSILEFDIKFMNELFNKIDFSDICKGKDYLIEKFIIYIIDTYIEYESELNCYGYLLYKDIFSFKIIHNEDHYGKDIEIFNFTMKSKKEVINSKDSFWVLENSDKVKLFLEDNTLYHKLELLKSYFKNCGG